MNPIQQIEEVMGQPYGLEPRQVTNNQFSRFWHRLKHNGGISPKSIWDAYMYASSIVRLSAFYDSEHHTVFAKHPRLRGANLANIHEYTHGYNAQRDGTIWHNAETERAALLFTGSAEEAEAMMVNASLDEGISDYVSIQAEKRMEDRRENLKLLTHLHRDLHFVSMLDIKDDQSSNRYSLDVIKQNLGKISVEGAYMMKLYELCSGKKSFSQADFDQERMTTAKYIIGYIAARAIFKDVQAGIGSKVDSLVKSPPKTFKALEELAFYS